MFSRLSLPLSKNLSKKWKLNGWVQKEKVLLRHYILNDAMPELVIAQQVNEYGRAGDVCIRVSEAQTYDIQELHLPEYHCWCLMLEENFLEENGYNMASYTRFIDFSWFFARSLQKTPSWDESNFFKSLRDYIYIFHMPLFFKIPYWKRKQ